MRKVAMLLVATLLSSQVYATSLCSELELSSTGRLEVEAAIPAFTPLCYAFSIKTGQEATIRISAADRMNFGLETVRPDGQTKLLVDRRQAYTLKAQTRLYHVLVASEDLHPDTEHRFTLVIEIK